MQTLVVITDSSMFSLFKRTSHKGVRFPPCLFVQPIDQGFAVMAASASKENYI